MLRRNTHDETVREGRLLYASGMYMGEGWIDQHSWVPGVAVGVIGIAVGTALTLFTFLKTRDRKSLEFRVMNHLSVLPREALNHADLRLSYQNDVLDEPSIVTFAVVNTGNRPIVREDFHEPIRLRSHVHNSAKFVSGVATAGLSPTLVGPVLAESPAGKTVSIAPKVMNPGDVIVVQYLYDGRLKPVLDCKFTGQIGSMQYYYEMSGPSIKDRVLFGVLAIVIGLLYIISLVKGYFWNDKIDSSTSNLALVAFILIFPMLVFRAMGLFERFTSLAIRNRVRHSLHND